MANLLEDIEIEIKQTGTLVAEYHYTYYSAYVNGKRVATLDRNCFGISILMEGMDRSGLFAVDMDGAVEIIRQNL
jgi:hypothetical protein